MTGKVVILIAVLGVAGNASADTIYSYVGSAYDDILDLPRPAGTFDTSMRVAGTFALAAPLAPGMPLTDVTALLERSRSPTAGTRCRTSSRRSR